MPFDSISDRWEPKQEPDPPVARWLVSALVFWGFLAAWLLLLGTIWVIRCRLRGYWI